MIFPLADAQSAILLSIYKPMVLTVVLGAWAWAATKIDKDLEYFYLPRQLWNGIEITAAAAAFGLWLLIPWFWVGALLAVLILSGGLLGYAMFRNTKVPETARWTLSLKSFTAPLDAKAEKNAQARATVHMLTPDGGRLDVPTGADGRAAAHAKLEEVMDFALPRHAERIDLAVAGTDRVGLVVQIDGVKYAQPAFDGRVALALIDYLKEHAGLDVADRRRRQSGTLNIDAGATGQHKLGLVSAGSTRELALAIRVDPDKRMALPLGKVGLLDAQLKALTPVLAAGHGLILAAAPPRQGLTTTLYSFVHQHDPYTQSIVTLEDEVAFEIEGVNHNTLEPGADAAAISEKVAALLRQDPQVLMIGQVNDSPTSKVVARAANDVRLYVGLRQEDTFNALRAWIKAVEDPKAAAEGLAAIVAQRLLRKLCPTCRVPFKPDPTALKKMNLPADRVNELYKQSGQVMVKGKPEPCPDCLGLAYRGRVGVFEVMVLDAPARQLIAVGQLDQLRTHLRKQKMLWLQEAALAKVVEGVTSVAEVTRAMTGK